ncbi:ankyrin repeat-containing domain protein [Triangularia verruculosa]|uniref:Ankyrin repeat-containing domain protein n=1 Tax=Triangularia verruculosa TaxID=2587418 RepID=A0AAN7AZL8_9PEZI|nr:ankyrin repeat-containing domain protein [Triangularia verruculosa]
MYYLFTVDVESGVIWLVHYTAQDYFERTQKQWLPNAEAEITKIYLTYPSFSVHLAACFGLRDAIVALLENRSEPDLKDTHARTPLSYAAERGYKDVVTLLLGNERVDPDAKDSALGWTPLWYAVAGGQVAVVKLLLEKGHNVVVKLLLDKAGVDLDPKDFEFGRTPLSWAAERGYKAVVKVLLANDGIDPGSKSKYGRTPLWFARFSSEQIGKQIFTLRCSLSRPWLMTCGSAAQAT